MVRTALWRWYVQSSIKFAYIVLGIFSLIIMVRVWRECVSIVMVYVMVRILSAGITCVHFKEKIFILLISVYIHERTVTGIDVSNILISMFLDTTHHQLYNTTLYLYCMLWELNLCIIDHT